jgi:hypothetical protein
MNGKIKLESPDITIEFDSDIKDLKLSTQYLEFKTTSKVKIHSDENIVKFIVSLLRR